MLRRKARGPREIKIIPVGDLRLDVGDHDAPDGTLRVIENLQPSGHSANPFYTPFMPFTGIVPTSEFTGTVCAIGKQTRDRIGDFATYTVAGLERYIVVTTSDIYIYDQEYERITNVYTFAADESTRKCQFASVGPMTVLAVSVSDKPNELLQIRDDACFDYNPPALPIVIGYKKADTTDSDALEDGVYAYRYAYEFVDGSTSGVSRPYILDVRSAVNEVRLAFTIQAISVTDNWAKLIRRVVVYMTQSATTVDASHGNYLDTLMEGPFYEITSISTLEKGAEVEWSKKNAEILGGTVVDDASLLQHDITAAAIFAYNQRLMFGDVEYDFLVPANYSSLVSSVRPPVISVPSPAYISSSGGTLAALIADPDGDPIQVVTMDTIPSGFDYQVQYLSGSSWVDEGAVNTDYADTSGTYTSMRVLITETTASGGVNLFSISAEDDGGHSTTNSFFVLVI